jgi:hypothetical protein
MGRRKEQRKKVGGEGEEYKRPKLLSSYLLTHKWIYDYYHLLPFSSYLEEKMFIKLFKVNLFFSNGLPFSPLSHIFFQLVPTETPHKLCTFLLDFSPTWYTLYSLYPPQKQDVQS